MWGINCGFHFLFMTRFRSSYFFFVWPMNQLPVKIELLHHHHILFFLIEKRMQGRK